MKFAYADPPYLGMCGRMYEHHHPDGRCWDDLDTHRLLIERLSAEYDGWAVSLSSPSLQRVLPLCPPDVRVMAWTKPFASFKPGVNPGYCWEPVIVRGGRAQGRDVPTVRDYCAANITLRRGFQGAKPEAFCFWLFDVLGMVPGDEFVDLFPGSGAVGEAYEKWRHQHSLLRGA